MQFKKTEGQSWTEIFELVDSFYSEKSDETFHWEIVDGWDQAVLAAVNEIRQSVSSLPGNERNIQSEARWKDWLKNNPKPLQVDQMERFDLSRGLKPISAEDIRDALDNWDKAEKSFFERLKDPEVVKQVEAKVEKIMEKIKSSREGKPK